MAATNPVMPRITPPRTVETFKIDQLKRQFHQWYYMEKMSLPIVKQNFDKLFYDVFRITGFKFEVTEDQWSGRLRKWNKVWGLKSSRNSEQVLVPEDCTDLLLWREWDKQHLFLNTYTPGSCGSHEATHFHLATSDPPGHSASGIPDRHTSASGLSHPSSCTCVTCSAKRNSYYGRTAHASDPAYHTALPCQEPWSYDGYASFPGLEGAHGKPTSSSFPPLTANSPALESGSRLVDEHQQNQLDFHLRGQTISPPSRSTWNHESFGNGSSEDNAIGHGSIGNDPFEEFTHGNDFTSQS